MVYALYLSVVLDSDSIAAHARRLREERSDVKVEGELSLDRVLHRRLVK